MRKFYLFMAAVFCAATTFTGCSDDDGGNDGSGGNGQGLVTAVPVLLFWLRKLLRFQY